MGVWVCMGRHHWVAEYVFGLWSTFMVEKWGHGWCWTGIRRLHCGRRHSGRYSESTRSTRVSFLNIRGLKIMTRRHGNQQWFVLIDSWWIAGNSANIIFILRDFMVAMVERIRIQIDLAESSFINRWNQVVWNHIGARSRVCIHQWYLWSIGSSRGILNIPRRLRGVLRRQLVYWDKEIVASLAAGTQLTIGRKWKIIGCKMCE